MAGFRSFYFPLIHLALLLPQPLLTPTWVIGSFLAIGILFIIIGIIVDAASNSVVEVSARYDNKPLAPTNCNPLSDFLFVA